MHLKVVYDFRTGRTFSEEHFGDEELSEVIQYAMWSSEPVPFDPMEKSLHQVYGKTQKNDLRPYFEMFHEYPLEGQPPMMTHLFKNEKGDRIIAAKGAPEAIINVCQIPEEKEKSFFDALQNGVNTVPGFSAESIVPKQAKAAGFKLKDFFGALVEEALK